MSTTPRLLDCTLRDGGNQNNWRFSQSQANEIVARLDRARVDVIEVGYRGGSGSRRDPDAGLTADSSVEFLRSLPKTTHAEIAVMVVPSVCQLSELESLAANGVSVLRIAAYPWDLQLTGAFVVRARELGMTATVNLMAVSYVSSEAIVDHVTRSDSRPDVFYIADSFGSLRPEDIAVRIRLLHDALGVPLGVHVHNNLGLAAANTMAALSAGATWVDASLCGMARGAGNLPTEQAVGLLVAWPGFAVRADLRAVAEAAAFVSDEVLVEPMQTGLDEIASGVNDHHYYFQPHIRAESERFGLDALEVGRAVGRARPQSVRREIVTAICENIIRQRRDAEKGANA